MYNLLVKIALHIAVAIIVAMALYPVWEAISETLGAMSTILTQALNQGAQQ